MRYELERIEVKIAKNGYVVKGVYIEELSNGQNFIEEEFITMNREGVKGYIDSILRGGVRDV